MSWNAYIDSICDNTADNAGTKHCDRAAIVGLNGSCWTTCDHSKSMKLEPSEITKLANAMSSGDTSILQSGGIVLEGVKYQFLRGDDKMILGKKKDHGAITIQASKTALVIGHTQEGCQQGNTNKGVDSIVTYLEGINM